MKTIILSLAFAVIMVSCGNNGTIPTVDTVKPVDTIKVKVDTAKCDTACKKDTASVK